MSGKTVVMTGSIVQSITQSTDAIFDIIKSFSFLYIDEVSDFTLKNSGRV